MFIWSKHFGFCRETDGCMLSNAAGTDFEIELESVNLFSYACFKWFEIGLFECPCNFL